MVALLPLALGLPTIITVVELINRERIRMHIYPSQTADSQIGWSSL